MLRFLTDENLNHLIIRGLRLRNGEIDIAGLLMSALGTHPIPRSWNGPPAIVNIGPVPFCPLNRARAIPAI